MPALLCDTNHGRLHVEPVPRRVRQLHQHTMPALHAMPSEDYVPGGRIQDSGWSMPELHEMRGLWASRAKELLRVRRHNLPGPSVQQERAVRDPRGSCESIDHVLRLLVRRVEGILRGLPQRLLVRWAVLSRVCQGKHVQSPGAGGVQGPVQARTGLRVHSGSIHRVRGLWADVPDPCTRHRGPLGEERDPRQARGGQVRDVLPVWRGLFQGVQVHWRGGVRGLPNQPSALHGATGALGDRGAVRGG